MFKLRLQTTMYAKNLQEHILLLKIISVPCHVRGGYDYNHNPLSAQLALSETHCCTFVAAELCAY